MKRADIEVNGEYYYDRSGSWVAGGWGHAGRAVVVDDKRYAVSGFNDARYSESSRGNRVLVDLYRPNSTTPVRLAVPITHLRGPWEQTKALVEAAIKRRGDVRRSEQEERDRLAKVSAEAYEAAGKIGVGVTIRYSPAGVVEIDGAALLAMAVQLEATGWRYERPEER